MIGPSWSRLAPAVSDPVNQPNQYTAANQIAYCDGHEVAEQLAYGDGVADHHAEWNEIHIGDAVLETQSDKGRDRKNYGEDFSGDIASRVAKPDG